MAVVLAAYATVLLAAFVLLKIGEQGGQARGQHGIDTAIGVLSLLLIVVVSVPIPALVCRRGRDAGVPWFLVSLFLAGWFSPVLQNVLDMITPAAWAHAIGDAALALQMTWLIGILALAVLPTRIRQA